MGNRQCCDRQENDEYKPTFPEEGIQEIKIAKIQSEAQLENPSHGVSNPSMGFANPHQSNVLSSLKNPAGPDTLPLPVKERLQHFDELEQSIRDKQTQTKQFGRETYVGQIDANDRFPEGLGKIYKADGGLYLGEWKKGKANGKGVYIMKDGAYYEGNFKDNKAEGIGKFHSGDYYYEGHFVHNKFQGIGTEKDPNHTYHGEFFEGYKTNGTYVWKDQGLEYEYIGKFNFDNQFEGQGVLKDPNGIYEGEFLKGDKHGYGIYRFSNGLKYEGNYKNGKKCGQGTIFNCNNSIAYEGEFDDDIPHGVGYVYDENGEKMKRKWVNGIDAQGMDEQEK